jgi:hypothetical protein
MPLVLVHKERVAVEKAAARRPYQIARAHEAEFERAFIQTITALVEASMPEVIAALERHDPQGAINALFPPLAFARDPVWLHFRDRIADTYQIVANQSASEVLRRRNTSLVNDLHKDDTPAQDVINEAIEKARRKGEPTLMDARPFARKWIERRTARLVVEVTREQKQALREVILSGYNAGHRPEVVAREVRKVVGLTSREIAAMHNRRDTLLASGVSPDQAARASGKYGQQLLTARAKRIARTELKEAESAGQLDAWREARNEGLISQRVMRTWVASGEACEICQDLDGQVIELDGAYESEEEVDHPPAHPNCECTETLIEETTE